MIIPLRFRALTLLAVAFLTSALPGRAGNSVQLVCVGQIKVGAEEETVPNAQGIEKLAMVYTDQQQGAFQRTITVSMARIDTTYVGAETMSSSRQKANVVLRNVDDPKDVIFKGTVDYLSGYAGIRIDGEYITVAKSSRHVHTKLAGYFIQFCPIPTPTKADQ